MPITRNTPNQIAITGRHNKLRTQHDKNAPQVRELAEAKNTASQTAVDLKMHLKRVQLIGRENGLRFAEPS